MKYFAIIILGLIITLSSEAQIIENPNFGSKTHPTLSILKVDKSSLVTKVYFRAVNKQANEDWFCVDRNTWLVEGTTKLKLVNTDGIENCPENFKFTKKGQELNFNLRFPPIKPTTNYIDIIEDCNNFCFRFNGLIINTEINNILNLAYSQFKENKLNEAAQGFEKALKMLENYPYAIYTYNLIEIYSQLKNQEKLDEWKLKFASSMFYDKAIYSEMVDKL